MPGFMAFISSFNLRVGGTISAGLSGVNGFLEKKHTRNDHQVMDH